jgi:asparagine synthase (glutamine-hydrolysing)
LGDLGQWIQGYEEPFHGLAANFEISKLAKENGVTVVLNGLGGDELFAGYGHYKYHRIPHFKWFRPFSNNLSRLVGSKAKKMLSLVGTCSVDRIHTELFSVANDSELRKLFIPELCPSESTPDILHNLYAKGIDFGDSLEAMSYMDIMNYIGNHHVHRVDQFTMAHSVEGRFPFLDHKLIEAAFKIPSRLKIKNNQQKYILRRVAEKYIAPECLCMKKKGFGLPLEQWMRGPLSEITNTSLDRLARRPEVQGSTIREWHLLHKQGGLPPQRIWHLVALDLWFEEFIDFRKKNSSATC